MKGSCLKKRGFTLAEVLITLGIIGVVAALTIPALMNSNQNTQYVVALKKAYSETNQALKQVATDAGCSNDLKCTGLFGASTNNQTLGDELVKYFKVAKNCGITTGKGCWAAVTNTAYDGSTPSTSYNYHFDNDPYYKFITADGMSFAIYNYATGGDSSCSVDWSAPPPQKLGYMSQTCGDLFIDVNGLKGPNYMGRDVFWFFITNGKGASLYPRGGIDDYDAGSIWWNRSNENNCSPSGYKYGYFCGGRIMEKGWVMDY